MNKFNICSFSDIYKLTFDELSSLEGFKDKKISNILKSIEHASFAYKQKYFNYPEDAISLYVDKSFRPEYDSEIYMDINLSHYPLRDFKDMWSEMHNIVKQYNKIGRRNERAYVHDKIEKHIKNIVSENDLVITIGAGPVNEIAKNLVKE